MSIPARVTGMLSGQMEPSELRRCEKEIAAEVNRLLGAFVITGIVGPEDVKKDGTLKEERIQIRKFPVTQYQADALKQLCPPENITVSEWAENYRVLDSKTSALPGPWRNDKTPYLKERSWMSSSITTRKELSS